MQHAVQHATDGAAAPSPPTSHRPPSTALTAGDCAAALPGVARTGLRRLGRGEITGDRRARRRD